MPRLLTNVVIVLLALGAAGSAVAEPGRDMLGKARTQSDMRAVKGLIERLEAGQPAAITAKPAEPAAIATPEAELAEQMAKELAEEPPKAEYSPQANVMSFSAARGGQPTSPAESPSALETAPAVVAAPAPAQAPPVAPGIHLSPALPVAAAPPAAIAPAPTAPPVLPAITLPELPPLPPRLPAVASQPAEPPIAAPARRPVPSANHRRNACNEILQRATLGELTEEDRAILRTQCR